MSSKMYVLTFTLANCDVHDVEVIAVSPEVKNLKAKAELHCEEMNDGSVEETIGKWKNGRAPVLTNGEDYQEMYYSIALVEEV